MDGSCEEDALGVRGVFCDREYKAVWPCPENVSCFVQSNRKREATSLLPWSCSCATLAFTYQTTACVSRDPATLDNSDDSVFT